ncbi:hypothetical protein GCM10009840_21120 [Pseudolysinimonas kribbensis]|uniref:Uncharacterized protein n=1 Tax=Pseudolysinimonas kribbensis TaxID=433641 RepID=A0ABQ6JY87_9MICO|nr:hypothetical protein [Pseudolysinimonas kribbensis]GMA93285.1 hypothetical protein GCM10025881_01090 [Pseudolysinimonas kribbensis]GMA97186.1 hypothetical protein GCM10025881_40100 [Pseudolysinimonas kribbensis]
MNDHYSPIYPDIRHAPRPAHQPKPCGICGDPDHTTAYHPLPEDPSLAIDTDCCQ